AKRRPLARLDALAKGPAHPAHAQRKALLGKTVIWGVEIGRHLTLALRRPDLQRGHRRMIAQPCEIRRRDMKLKLDLRLPRAHRRIFSGAAIAGKSFEASAAGKLCLIPIYQSRVTASARRARAAEAARAASERSEFRTRLEFRRLV